MSFMRKVLEIFKMESTREIKYYIIYSDVICANLKI